MVEETQRQGASVAEVAQRYHLNANLLFGGRRFYEQGVLNEDSSSTQAALLPVKVSTPTLLPTEQATRKPKPRASKESGEGSIEIEFPSGQRLCIRGRVDHSTLMRVLAVLSRQ